MSMESAKAFVERMKTDREFVKKVGSIEDKEARKKFVVEEGYSFTKEEIDEISSELSDVELDSVAGAYGCLFADKVCVLDSLL